MNEGPLHLNDDDFWTDPRRTRDEIQDPLMRAGREMLLFDAPSVVPIDVRETAPTQALRVAKFATLSQRPFRDTAIVVAVDLADNQVYADLAVTPTERETDPTLAKYTGPPVEGIGAETFTIDLRQRLELPWEPASFLTRLIVHDLVTDARLIELQRSAAAFVDPEVEKFKAQERNKTNVPLVSPPPGEPLPSYRADAQAPAPPPSDGIVLSAPRVFPLDSHAPCLLRGAFRLPVLRRHVVPRRGAPGAEGLRAQLEDSLEPAKPFPTAVVPITLVATGTEIVGPMVWRLIVPTYTRIDAKAEHPIATGVFALDLRGFEGFELKEQTWYLYAFSEGSMAGPVPIALTRRPRTP